MNKATPPAVGFLPDQTPPFAHRTGIVPEARPHRMSEVLALVGADAEAWADACPVRQTRVRAGSLLYGEGSPAQALHVVHHGSFKCLRFAEDGYEHVLGLGLAGDVLGFEGLADQRQTVGMMALENASVLTLPLAELDIWRRRSAGLDQALQRAVSLQLTRAREMTTMMAAVAAVAAEARLARFLVWMSQRMALQGRSPMRFVLRMSRRDIASLLAVAHETVSRSFGLLAEWGLVRVDSRDVEILDLPALKACARSTRRDADDPHHRGAAAGAARTRGRSVEDPAAW